MADIILTTINAKWIHPSLALRLLKANLGAPESGCEIIEFALRQPLSEKLESLIAAKPLILGISVSIWNHLATIELLEALEEERKKRNAQKPVIVLGGPEVSHLPPDAKIFALADFCIRGEGEIAFRELCEKVLAQPKGHLPMAETQPAAQSAIKFIDAENVDVSKIKSAYHLYFDDASAASNDLAKKLIYVESSRGCPFNCEFCLSAIKDGFAKPRRMPPFQRTLVRRTLVREFPLEPFLAEMNALIEHGAKTFKFLDRTFNANIKRALQIMDFFLEKIKSGHNIVVHFEMVPSLFTDELRQKLSCFPPDTLRLEIGIQTLNGETAERIGLPGGKRRYADSEKELEAIRFLCSDTNAIVHADLIAGLPGEDIVSFGKGFDRLWLALTSCLPNEKACAEIQLGILKLLPAALIARHTESFKMFYNPLPPYEVIETSAMSASDIARIKNFARFWELLVNRGAANSLTSGLVINWYGKPVFEKFIALSDALFARFGRNWGIDKHELIEAVEKFKII